MADQFTEKPQHEKLPTLYGTEACGKPFRIIGDTWERYKSSYNFRDDKVFAKRKDMTLPASAPGNFEVFDDDAKEYRAADYHAYDTYVVTRADGTTFKGRVVNSDLPPWDNDDTGKPNFEIETSEGWKRVDYNSLVDGGAKVDHENRLKRVQYLPVSLLDPAQVGDKTVQRAKIELSKTAVDALTTITNTLLKADANPRNYAYAFSYIEADKQYVIQPDDYRKLTDDERAAAATEDTEAATSAIDNFTPPGANGRDSDFPYPTKEQVDVSSIPF